MASEPEQTKKYLGSYRHGVDPKRRIQIPSKWRTAEGGIELVLMLWTHNRVMNSCLMVLPPGPADQFYRSMTSEPFGEWEAEAVRAFTGESSDTVVIDSAGRIAIPEWMAQAVGIKDQSVLVGLWDRFQIWDPTRFDETRVDVRRTGSEHLPKIK